MDLSDPLQAMGKQALKRPSGALKRPSGALKRPAVALGPLTEPAPPSSSREPAPRELGPPRSQDLAPPSSSQELGPASSQELADRFLTAAGSESPAQAAPPEPPAPRRFWLHLDEDEPAEQYKVVCLQEQPGRLLINQFFDVEAKNLLHLSIRADLTHLIPSWNWHDPVHKIIRILVEPTPWSAVLGQIIWVHGEQEDISHEDYKNIADEWARARNEEHLENIETLERQNIEALENIYEAEEAQENLERQNSDGP